MNKKTTSLLAICAFLSLGISDSLAQRGGRFQRKTTETRSNRGRGERIVSPHMNPLSTPTISLSESTPVSSPVSQPSSTDDSSAVAEIKARYAESNENAQKFCSGLSGKLDVIKVMAGVSTAASAVGTAAAGTAFVTGLIKSSIDKNILEQVKKTAVNANKLITMGEKEFFSNRDLLKETLQNLKAQIRENDATRARLTRELTQLEKDINKSRVLGTVRTAGLFVAGGTSAVAATTSFMGASQFDELAKNMNACDSYIKEIKDQRTELAALKSSDQLLTQMDNIVISCSGLNSGNIIDVKSKFLATGIISSVGAATGLAGGITSAIAGHKEKQGALGAQSSKDGGTKGLNVASNVLAGVTTATAATSTIISGITLSDLMKNSEIADACAKAF